MAQHFAPIAAGTLTAGALSLIEIASDTPPSLLDALWIIVAAVCVAVAVIVYHFAVKADPNSVAPKLLAVSLIAYSLTAIAGTITDGTASEIWEAASVGGALGIIGGGAWTIYRLADKVSKGPG